MNEELITMNEVLNDGSNIYLYQQESTGIWVTYGYSAYLLAHMQDIKCLSNFSEHMQMPCVCMTEADFKKLVIANMKVIEVKDGYYHLPSNTNVEQDSYQTWTNSLK